MIVAAIYLLYMVGVVLFGPLREPSGHHAHPTLPTDLNAREIGILLPLAAGCVILGLFPTPVIKSIEPANESLLALYENITPDHRHAETPDEPLRGAMPGLPRHAEGPKFLVGGPGRWVAVPGNIRVGNQAGAARAEDLEIRRVDGPADVGSLDPGFVGPSYEEQFARYDPPSALTLVEVFP